MPSGYTACDTCIFNRLESEPTLCDARTNGNLAVLLPWRALFW
jgi:hypothetical protein